MKWISFYWSKSFAELSWMLFWMGICNVPLEKIMLAFVRICNSITFFSHYCPVILIDSAGSIYFEYNGYDFIHKHKQKILRLNEKLQDARTEKKEKKKIWKEDCKRSFKWLSVASSNRLEGSSPIRSKWRSEIISNATNVSVIRVIVHFLIWNSHSW